MSAGDNNGLGQSSIAAEEEPAAIAPLPHLAGNAPLAITPTQQWVHALGDAAVVGVADGAATWGAVALIDRYPDLSQAVLWGLLTVPLIGFTIVAGRVDRRFAGVERLDYVAKTAFVLWAVREVAILLLKLPFVWGGIVNLVLLMGVAALSVWLSRRFYPAPAHYTDEEESPRRKVSDFADSRFALTIWLIVTALCVLRALVTVGSLTVPGVLGLVLYPTLAIGVMHFFSRMDTRKSTYDDSTAV